MNPSALKANNWEDLTHLMTKGQRKTHVTIAGNTVASWWGWSGVAIRLHNSYIAVLYENGVVAIRTDGWATPTTLRRLAAVIPDTWRITSMKRVPYAISLVSHSQKSLEIPASDFLMLGPDGKQYKYVLYNEFNPNLKDQHQLPEE